MQLNQTSTLKFASIFRRLTLILFLCFLIQSNACADGYSQPADSRDSLSKYIDFVGKTIIGRFGLRYKLDKYGIPTSITGDLNKGLTGTDVVEKSYQFFELNKDIFQIINPRKEFIIRDVINEGMYTVKFYWALDGAKVQYGGYFLHFNKNGALYTVEGQIDPEARMINPTPAISEEQALDIARKDTINKDPNAQLIEQEIYIGRFSGSIRLLRRLSLMDGISGKPWRFIIDAHTGEVLESKLDVF